MKKENKSSQFEFIPEEDLLEWEAEVKDFKLSLRETEQEMKNELEIKVE